MPILSITLTEPQPLSLSPEPRCGMAKGLSTLALLGLSLLATVHAHNIQMGAHSRECFHEQLHKDDKMTVTFQVGDREFGGAGNLELDFWVSEHVRHRIARSACCLFNYKRFLRLESRVHRDLPSILCVKVE